MPLQQNTFVQTILIKEKVKWLTIIFNAAPPKVSQAHPSTLRITQVSTMKALSNQHFRILNRQVIL